MGEIDNSGLFDQLGKPAKPQPFGAKIISRTPWELLGLPIAALMVVGLAGFTFSYIAEQSDMGIFRVHKAKNYTVEGARRLESQARGNVFNFAGEATSNRGDWAESESREFSELLHRWAEARELLARKEGENQSNVR